MTAPTLTPEAVVDMYRMAQAQIAGDAAARTVVAFNTLLDPSNLDKSFERYLRVISRITDDARRRAASAGGHFYLTYREAMQIVGEVPPVAFAGTLPAEQMATTALVTGPVEVKRTLIRGEPIAVAMNKAAAMSAGAVFRLTANAGRDTIDRTTLRDTKALGWARVTDGNPCAFCAMLAGRGAVYKSEQKAMGQLRRYHAKCGCHPAPVFRHDDPVPGKGHEFFDLWDSTTAGKSGKDAVNAFRREYEAMQRGA